MTETLNCILLIDDDAPTIYLNKLAIKQADCVKHIEEKYSGPDALKYLKTKDKGAYPKPEIIFLDVNMPGMDGWQFLEEYIKLEENQKANYIYIMLTTALKPPIREKVEKFNVIKGYLYKPLNNHDFNEILKENFQHKYGG